MLIHPWLKTRLKECKITLDLQHNDSRHFPNFCSFFSFLLLWKTNHSPPKICICIKHQGKHKMMTLFQQFNLNTFMFFWKYVQHIHLSLWKMRLGIPKKKKVNHLRTSLFATITKTLKLLTITVISELKLVYYQSIEILIYTGHYFWDWVSVYEKYWFPTL